MRGLAVIATLAAGCSAALGENDAIYSRPGDGPIVCGANIDDKNSVSVDAIGAAMTRASDEAAIVHLYAHAPPVTAQAETIEAVVAIAADRGLPLVRYRELPTTPGPGVALSFDDHHIAAWLALRPTFARHGARVTFFVSGYHTLTAEEKAGLRQLAEDGHDIQYHSTNHRNAADYAATHGAAAWITDDIAPDLAALRGDGYDPTAFAYPYGARNATTDAAILTVLPLARGSDFSCPR